MCNISYEKCVCFVLLVIVAFLNCSGFRIDRLAMTDLSKKNSHTSSSIGSSRSDSNNNNNLFLDRLIAISSYDISNNDNNNNDSNTAVNVKHRYRRNPNNTELQLSDRIYHRIRHARKLRHGHQHHHQAARNESDRNASQARAWIDIRVVDAKNETEMSTNRNYPPQLATPSRTTSPPTTEDLVADVQVSPSELVLRRPTHAIVNRLQRSPPKNKHRQKRKKKRPNNHCQKQDLARNAYIADTVILARAESMSVNRTVNANYSVTFRIIEVFKSREPRTSETVRLTFIYSKRAQNCEPKHESRLVKANIKKMKEYFLFLKSDGSYSYTVYRTPMLRKKEARKKGGKKDGDRKKNGNISNDSQIAIVRKVCNATFAPIIANPQIEQVEEEKTISITCTAKGFPIPLVMWLMNNTKISPERDRRQVVYNRRNSTLTIDKTEFGFYRCMTSIGTESRTSKETFNKSDMRQCKKNEAYCMNGGDCYIILSLGEVLCSCLDGFGGRRCDQKSSTYQQNITSCNLPQYKYSHFCKD